MFLPSTLSARQHQQHLRSFSRLPVFTSAFFISASLSASCCCICSPDAHHQRYFHLPPLLPRVAQVSRSPVWSRFLLFPSFSSSFSSYTEVTQAEHHACPPQHSLLPLSALSIHSPPQPLPITLLSSASHTSSPPPPPPPGRQIHYFLSTT